MAESALQAAHGRLLAARERRHSKRASEAATDDHAAQMERMKGLVLRDLAVELTAAERSRILAHNATVVARTDAEVSWHVGDRVQFPTVVKPSGHGPVPHPKPT